MYFWVFAVNGRLSFMATKNLILGLAGAVIGWIIAGFAIPESACVFANFGCVENLFIGKAALALVGGFVGYKMA